MQTPTIWAQAPQAVFQPPVGINQPQQPNKQPGVKRGADAPPQARDPMEAEEQMAAEHAAAARASAQAAAEQAAAQQQAAAAQAAAHQAQAQQAAAAHAQATAHGAGVGLTPSQPAPQQDLQGIRALMMELMTPLTTNVQELGTGLTRMRSEMVAANARMSHIELLIQAPEEDEGVVLSDGEGHDGAGAMGVVAVEDGGVPPPYPYPANRGGRGLRVVNGPAGQA